MISLLQKYITTQQVASDVVRGFSGEMTGVDEAAILQRKSLSKDYRHELSANYEMLADLDQLADDQELLALVGHYPEVSQEEPLISKPVVSTVSVRSWPKLALAASLIIAVAIGWGVTFKPVEPESNILRYVTRTGEQKTVTLKDGSVLTLNTATQVLVDFSGNSRRVIMEYGEVYYDIEPDSKRPFTIELGERSVTVFGTEFNIHRVPEKFTLAVVEGGVLLHKKSELASLAAPLFDFADGEIQVKGGGQRRIVAGTVVEFDMESRIYNVHRDENVGQFQSWRSGIVGFKNTPLHAVVKELNRYSGKKVFIEDSTIMDLPVRAAIRINNVNVALMGLESTLPIKVTSDIDRIVLTGK